MTTEGGRILVEKIGHDNDDGTDLRVIPSVWPVDRSKTWVSSNFGQRRDPFTGLTATHSGIDIAGKRGLKVWATADGVIAFAYSDKHLGNVVVINHNPEIIDEDDSVTNRFTILRTEYGHLDEVLVKKGDHVSRGQIIGFMGSTGRSKEPHLHYAVRYQDRSRGGHRGYMNPMDYLLDSTNEDDSPKG